MTTYVTAYFRHTSPNIVMAHVVMAHIVMAHVTAYFWHIFPNIAVFAMP